MYKKTIRDVHATMKDAVGMAQVLMDDFQESHAIGSTMNMAEVFQMAERYIQEDDRFDPLLGAALILLACQRLGFEVELP